MCSLFYMLVSWYAGWRMQETWRYNECTWKTSFLRLHFWFILIYFQKFFSKIWVAKLGVRLFCECSLYASVYGISLVLCLSHKCEPGFRIQWNTFHDHKITKLYNRTLWAMQHQFQSHPSISPFSPVALKWTINKEFQPKVWETFQDKVQRPPSWVSSVTNRKSCDCHDL